MFQRLYELGNFLGTDQLDPWDLLNQGMAENYDRGLAICFDQDGDYVGVKHILGNQGVIFVPGPGANSAPLIPCTPLSQKMDTKIKYLFACTEDNAQEEMAEGWKSWFQAVSWQKKDLQQRVVVDLADKAVEAGIGTKWTDKKRTRSGYCFPARFVDDLVQPVYELESAKRLMVKKAVSVWSKYGLRRGVCSICTQSTEVFGNFSELKCYNLDKPGMISGGFLIKQVDRNFPVCEPCALTISYAINYARKNLQARVAGQDYLVLPYCTIGGEPLENIKEELEANPSRFSISSQCDPLVNFEEELLTFMQEEQLKEQLAFALVFFQAKQKEWKILGEVQQVLPGRMREIQAANTNVSEDPLLVNAGKDKQPLTVNGWTLSEFSGGSGNNTSGRIVRQWLAAIFEGGTVDQKFVLHLICKKIMLVQRQKQQVNQFHAAQAWSLYLLFNFLDLFPQGGKPMETKFPDSPMGRYMQNHTDFFHRPEMIVAFLTGSYVSTVVSVQAKKRDLKPSKAPFLKKFIGRLLNRKLFKRLFREGHDKLAQYEALGIVVKNGLEADLAQTWVDCGDKWLISDDEATFGFTLGYSLAWRISSDEKK